MEWSSPASGTTEQIVVVRTLQKGRLTTNWIVAGINPILHAINAGEVPSGAVVGDNSYGKQAYSLCPTAGKAALVVLGVFALTKPLHLHSGFDANVVDGLVGTPGVSWGSLSAAIRRTAAATPSLG
jgi:hypothetical protein